MSEQLFTEHFWWCYERLKVCCSAVNLRYSRVRAADNRGQGVQVELGMPPYFYFLTLLAMRVFHAERVDVVVLEVGLGGRWDATNVVPAPVVCGITSLGYDHMDILGHTLTLIAGEKAGIMKRGVPAVTTEQPEEAAVVLRARADELQVRHPRSHAASSTITETPRARPSRCPCSLRRALRLLNQAARQCSLAWLGRIRD